MFMAGLVKLASGTCSAAGYQLCGTAGATQAQRCPACGYVTMVLVVFADLL